MSPLLRRVLGLGLSLGLPLGALAVLLLGLAPAAHASSIVVTTCNAVHLNDALAAAGDGDVITFACSPGPHTIVFTQTQVLAHNITIDGGSVITLSGGSAVRIFGVSSGFTVTLNNLTFRNGLAGQGGALRVFGAALIHHSSFISNSTTSTVSAAGGAIYVGSNGRVVVSQGHFVSNTVPFQEGLGGAIYSSGVLTVVDSVFNQNSSGLAGAIAQDQGRAYVAESTFNSNTALFGGAMTAFNQLVLFQDQFTFNYTAGIPAELQAPQVTSLTLGGGALNIASAAHVAISNADFEHNNAGNAIFGSGGAIVNDGALAVAFTNFYSNTAARDGGAIVNHGNLGIARSQINENHAQTGAGLSNTADLSLLTTLIAGNIASGNGGGLNNSGLVGASGNFFYKNNADAGGGAINQAGATLLSLDSTFDQNDAGGVGGALMNNGTLTLTNSTLAGNTTSTNGAAVFSGGNVSASALLLNDTIDGNGAPAGAGALRQTNGTLKLTNSIVSSNVPINCVGVVTNGGHNLQFGDTSCGGAIAQANPRLGPFQDNGGQVLGLGSDHLLTFGLLSTSPAINNADPAACPARDERGYLRVPICDIGAFEVAFPVFLPIVVR